VQVIVGGYLDKYRTPGGIDTTAVSRLLVKLGEIAQLMWEGNLEGELGHRPSYEEMEADIDWYEMSAMRRHAEDPDEAVSRMADAVIRLLEEKGREEKKGLENDDPEA
jgi:hypothetical protein